MTPPHSPSFVEASSTAVSSQHCSGLHQPALALIAEKTPSPPPSATALQSHGDECHPPHCRQHPLPTPHSSGPRSKENKTHSNGCDTLPAAPHYKNCADNHTSISPCSYHTHIISLRNGAARQSLKTLFEQCLHPHSCQYANAERPPCSHDPVTALNLQPSNHLPDVPRQQPIGYNLSLHPRCSNVPFWDSDHHHTNPPPAHFSKRRPRPAVPHHGLSGGPGHGDAGPPSVLCLSGPSLPSDCHDPGQHQAAAPGPGPCVRASWAQRKCGSHKDGLFPQEKLCLQLPGLQKDVLQELTPQGSPENTHRWEKHSLGQG